MWTVRNKILEIGTTSPSNSSLKGGSLLKNYSPNSLFDVLSKILLSSFMVTTHMNKIASKKPPPNKWPSNTSELSIKIHLSYLWTSSKHSHYIWTIHQDSYSSPQPTVSLEPSLSKTPLLNLVWKYILDVLFTNAPNSSSKMRSHVSSCTFQTYGRKIEEELVSGKYIIPREKLSSHK